MSFLATAQQSQSQNVRNLGTELAFTAYLYKHRKIPFSELANSLQTLNQSLASSIQSNPDKTPSLHETQFALQLASLAFKLLPLLL